MWTISFVALAMHRGASSRRGRDMNVRLAGPHSRRGDVHVSPCADAWFVTNCCDVVTGFALDRNTKCERAIIMRRRSDTSGKNGCNLLGWEEQNHCTSGPSLQKQGAPEQVD